MTTRHKLGLKAPRRESVKLRLADYFDHLAVLPSVPASFGHADLVTDWGMLGNDTVGDCAIAGPYHILELLNAEVCKTVPVSTSTALNTYSAITGYNPDDPSTDQGGDMTQVAQYWQETGFDDDNNNVHRIVTFAALEPGDLDQLAAATYCLGGAVGIGVNLPESAQDQFDDGKPWSVTSSPIEGGHFVPVVGRAPDANYQIVTWGALAEMEPAFYTAHEMLALAYLSREFLDARGLSPEHFDYDQLAADLADLQAA